MRKQSPYIIITLLYLAQGFIFAQDVQKQVAVFVYNDNTVTTPTNALSSRLTSSLVDGGNSQFVVVDRSEEILEQLNKEYQYQGSGLVRDDQLTSIGEHLGVDLICAINITYYSEYNQYFFDCKIVNVASRKVEKQVYFPNNNNGQRVISDLSPQTQLTVAQELSSAIGLLSSSQLIEREYSIGDIYYDKNNKPVGYGSYYRVGYLDGSKKHGIAYKVFEGKDKWPVRYDSNLGAHVPTIRQMQLLWVNRKQLGLYGEYWSCDRGPATQQYEKHYLMKAFDFYTGKTTIRNSATSGEAPWDHGYFIYYEGYSELENISVITF